MINTQEWDRQKVKKRKNWWKILAITFMIIGILLASTYGLLYSHEIARQEGYQQGALYTSQSGQIPYIDANNNIQVMELDKYAEDWCREAIKQQQGEQ